MSETRVKTPDSTPWDDTLFVGVESVPARAELAAVSERYETGDALGEGGMGEVYDAFDRVLRRQVALKVLRAELSLSSPQRDAFVNEARLTSQLEHPHIVPVHDLILEANESYAAFLMKRIEGRTLSAWLDDLALGPPRFEEVVEIMLKVCDAVSFAHSRGVLHLDLKPENVMLGEHGEVYVMDWGIAVRCELDEGGMLKPRSTHYGIRGSLGYMAPEQLDPGCDVDQRTDVHGLGAVLHEVLSGLPPYVPRPGSQTVRDRLPQPALSVLSQRSGRVLPPGLIATTERAIRPERSERFVSVAAFKAELEAFRRGGGWFASETFAAGTVIVEEGKEADAAYLITDGTCQVRQQQRDGEIVLREMGAGDVFGETALLTSGIRTATVIALTDVRVLHVTRDALERELSSRHWLGALVRALAVRFLEADRERASLREQLVEALRRPT